MTVRPGIGRLGDMDVVVFIVVPEGSVIVAKAGVHVVVYKISRVGFAVCPGVYSVSVALVVGILPDIHVAVGGNEGSLSVLQVVLELALVACTACPAPSESYEIIILSEYFLRSLPLCFRKCRA